MADKNESQNQQANQPPPVPLRESPSTDLRNASHTSNTSQQPQKPTKKFSYPHLCQFGQELVQELTYKALEIFQIFRTPVASLPTGQVQVSLKSLVLTFRS